MMLNAPAQRADWLRTDRLFGEMRTPKDSTVVRKQFERLMEEGRWAEAPGQWKELRRGWYLGEEHCRPEMLE